MFLKEFRSIQIYFGIYARIYVASKLIEALAIAVSIVMVVKAKNSLFSYLLPL